MCTLAASLGDLFLCINSTTACGVPCFLPVRGSVCTTLLWVGCSVPFSHKLGGRKSFVSGVLSRAHGMKTQLQSLSPGLIPGRKVSTSFWHYLLHRGGGNPLARLGALDGVKLGHLLRGPLYFGLDARFTACYCPVVVPMAAGFEKAIVRKNFTEHR